MPNVKIRLKPTKRVTRYTKEQQRVWKRNQRARPNRGRCVNCGRQATDWAHTGSLSSRTRPLCRSCHVALDNSAGLHRRKA